MGLCLEDAMKRVAGEICCEKVSIVPASKMTMKN